MTYIITGEYGSGKTEFCVNLALDLAKKGEVVTLADLDTVNPYFRSREKQELLNSHGITISSDHLGNNTAQDLPAVSYGFLSAISKKETLIIDLAGGTLGTNLLAPCYDALHEANNHQFLCLVNIYRQETSTSSKIVNFVRNINAKSGIKVTGLINNGHMLHHTEPEHILTSQEETLKACEFLNIPLMYTLLRKDLSDTIKSQLQSQNVITFDKLKLRESWQ